jgi:hypothetical protein
MALKHVRSVVHFSWSRDRSGIGYPIPRYSQVVCMEDNIFGFCLARICLAAYDSEGCRADLGPISVPPRWSHWFTLVKHSKVASPGRQLVKDKGRHTNRLRTFLRQTGSSRLNP